MQINISSHKNLNSISKILTIHLKHSNKPKNNFVTSTLRFLALRMFLWAYIPIRLMQKLSFVFITCSFQKHLSLEMLFLCLHSWRIPLKCTWAHVCPSDTMATLASCFESRIGLDTPRVLCSYETYPICKTVVHLVFKRLMLNFGVLMTTAVIIRNGCWTR